MTPRHQWYYDRQGEPIDMFKFGELAEDSDYKRVGLSTYPSLEDVEDPLDTTPVATVSTVWLGINHNFSLVGGQPVIFESMIFGGPYDGECCRYCTEDEATEGHSRIMENLREGRTPWFLEPDMELHNQIGVFDNESPSGPTE